MKGWGFAFLTSLLLSGALPAVAAPPPQPDLAREIREGRRPLPDFFRQLRKQGPPKLRGDRQVRKVLRDLKRQEAQDSGMQSLPAPGSELFDARAPAVSFPAPPALGPANVLTLLASFADVPPSEAPGYFDSLVFGFDGAEYGALAPSVSHYYREVSADSFTMVTNHLPSTIECTPGVGSCIVVSPESPDPSPPGWLPLAGYKATYQEDLRAMLVDAVAASDEAVDFSDYDNDGDGFVDYLILVHAGTGGEFTGSDSDIWSQTVNVAAVPTADGVSINTFMTVPEYWYTSQYVPMTIGVYVHEFGHLLGLPDLYDYDLDSKGIGDWGLMGLGMWNGARNRGESPSWPSAWSRVALGWVVPENPLSDLAGVVLTPVEETGPARGGPVYYLWDYGDDNSEFFLIENRSRQAGSYDAFIPGNGLLIWHIDESMPDNNSQIPNASPARHSDCSWPAHYRVALQQADGNMELEGIIALTDGDQADPYPGSLGKTVFSPTSTPNSGSYADCSSLVAVRNILKVGPGSLSIQADLEVSGPPIGSILIGDGAETTATSAVTLSLSASMTGGSSLGSMRFRNGGVATWDDWEPYQSTRAWTLSAGDGTKTVYAQFMDYAGSISDSDPVTPGEQGYEDTIILDSAAPVGTVLINDDAATTVTRTVTLTLAATDTGGSGVDAMRFRNGGVATWDAWEPYQGTKDWTLTAGDGTKTVYAQFMDYAGNVSDGDPVAPGDQGYADTIILDSAAPVGTILISGDAAATRTRAVTLTLAASFPGGSGPGAMRFRNDGSTWSRWWSYRTTKDWQLTSGAGIKTVSAQFRDKAGNISKSEDTIILDRKRPAGSILINNGDAATATTAVTLFLSAADSGGSGLDAMRFRNRGVSTWGDWEPYQRTKAWELTAGAGKKIVYAQFRDNAGNISDANPAVAGEQGYKDKILYAGL